MSHTFSLPQERIYTKPITESSHEKTTSSSVPSETSLPDKLKPIPVQSVLSFQKQQKKRTLFQKIFSCFYIEEEEEEKVTKSIKRETPKPIQQVILPGTGQPPKGIAPWERTGRKPQNSTSVAGDSNTSKHPTNTENDSAKSGNSSKSGAHRRLGKVDFVRKIEGPKSMSLTIHFPFLKNF